MQWQEELAVRESRRQPVGGMHRERRLTDPGHAANRMDSQYVARPLRRIHELPQFVLPAGKQDDVTWQRPCRPSPARYRRGSDRHAPPGGCLELFPGRPR